jgi:hypothetical protein
MKMYSEANVAENTLIQTYIEKYYDSTILSKCVKEAPVISILWLIS